MNDDEVAAKLSARIRSWKSCVGNGLELEAPESSGAGNAAPHSVASQLHPVPVLACAEPAGRRPEDPPNSTDFRDDQIHRLQESLAAERDRAQFLEQTLMREQALQAASLMLEARKKAEAERREVRRARPEPINPRFPRQVSETALQQLQRQRRQEVIAQFLTLLVVILLGCGGWYLLFRAL
jgi:hypothetical protein